jgi:DNA invertase Pin-like site-specific DNA recombinase
VSFDLFHFEVEVLKAAKRSHQNPQNKDAQNKTWDRKMHMTRVALYIRVSTEDQKIHGLSVEDQISSLSAWAEKEAVIVAGVYNDAGISARKPASKRPELQRLLDDVRARKIDLIVFTKLDRWFRNIGEYYKVQEVLETYGVGWKTIYEDYDTTTASGRLKINIMLSVAQDEADRTGERIKAIHESKLLRNEPISGKVPFGYKIEKKQLVIVPEDAEKVRDIFEHYIALRSVRALRPYVLETHGLVYTQTGLAQLLRNERYIGHAHGKPDFCPAILSEEVFFKAQNILKVRAERLNFSRTNRVYLFTGIVFCAECGNRLSAHVVGQKYVYYRCTRYEKTHLCSHKKRTSERTLENWLLHNLPAKIEEYNVTLQAQEKANKAGKDIAKINHKLNKLKELYLNDLISIDDYKSDYSALKEDLIKAYSSQTEHKKPIDVRKITELLSKYPDLSSAGKKEFWSRILKKIVITQNDDFLIEPY